jgi:hypothetical protein
VSAWRYSVWGAWHCMTCDLICMAPRAFKQSPPLSSQLARRQAATEQGLM